MIVAGVIALLLWCAAVVWAISTGDTAEERLHDDGPRY